MIKLIYCITRKTDLSVEEFQKHWRETHAPIAARIPGVRRYVQNHTLPELYIRGPVPAYDGAAEVWFDDIDSFRAALGTPEIAAAREDELKFIDHSRSALFITEEKPVVE
jgi:uncharacterized protein (TIGR02118 family)